MNAAVASAPPTWAADALDTHRPRWVVFGLAALGVLLLAGVAAFIALRRTAPAAPTPIGQVVAAQRTAVAVTVSVTGNVAPARQARLSFKAPGTIASVGVTTGDQVGAGQTLATLASDALRLKLAQTESQLATAQLRLAQLEEGAAPEEIAAARAAHSAALARYDQTVAGPTVSDVRAAEATLAAARSSYEQAAAKLASLESGAGADIAAAEAAVVSALSALESARAKLTQLEQGPTAEDLAAAQAALDQARANARAAESKVAQLRSPRPEDLAAGQAQVDQARTKLAQLRDAPRARPEDVANAQLAVRTAQVNLDRALADVALIGRSGGPATQAASDAAVAQATIALEKAQNDQSRVLTQGPTDWEIRLQEEALAQAEAALAKISAASTSDVDAAQAGLDAALAAVAGADAKLAAVRSGPTAADLTAARAAVLTAQGNADAAQAKLAAAFAGAEQDLIAAQAALSGAAAATLSAEAKLDTIRQGAAQADLESARSAVVGAAAALAAKSGPRASDLALQREAVRLAELSVQQARADLDAATLTAPFDGVVAAVNAAPGEQAPAGPDGMILLLDPRDVRVDVAVFEADVLKLQIGRAATVTFDALRGRAYPAKVIAIAPAGLASQGVVTYRASLAIDTSQPAAASPTTSPPASAATPGTRVPGSGAGAGAGASGGAGAGAAGAAGAQSGPQIIPAGLTAAAVITIQQRENVIAVPTRAIKTSGADRSVEVVLPNGATESRAVKVGLAGDQLTEVLEGLAEGEKVFVPSTSTRTPSAAGAAGLPVTSGSAPRS
ncbi:MAG TPA: HlyD family efflux transporter periplasmic adaptor subunit [Chloroflexota bacterium]|nr:HlyD family efflux transporter periplasmic adaptor subunit [Chloroflexota bacterium]